MRASRGMGAIKKTKIPSATENSMPKGVVKKRRDNTDFTQFKEGGPVGLYAPLCGATDDIPGLNDFCKLA